MFITNAIDDDQTTPVGPCVELYHLLLKAGAKMELQLYNKAGHGFDMGDGHGESVAPWKESFLAWTNPASISRLLAALRPVAWRMGHTQGQSGWTQALCPKHGTPSKSGKPQD